MTAHEVHQRTIAYGRKAFDSIQTFSTSAEPAVYELWYEHARGTNKELSAEINRHKASGCLSEREVNDLQVRFLSKSHLSDHLNDIGATAQAELGRLLEVVGQTMKTLGACDAELAAADAGLSADGPVGADVLRRFIDRAISATRRVGEMNRDLDLRLRESEDSIGTLRKTLEIARGEAMTDRLTTLFNRRALDEQLDAAVERAKTGRLGLTVLMIDIDHFKLFNDTHGHLVGDQVIRLVASCIRQCVDAADVAARYGGEEFAVVAPGRTLAEMVKVAETIRRKMDGYDIVQLGTKKSLGRVSVSIGATSIRSGDDAMSLLARADACLYRAKRGGRNMTVAD